MAEGNGNDLVLEHLVDSHETLAAVPPPSPSCGGPGAEAKTALGSLTSPVIAEAAFSSIFADELQPLLEDHYREADPLPGAVLAPNWAFYQKSYDLGILRIFTARHDGKLIGYMIWFVNYEPHCWDHLRGSLDAFYVVPEYRCRFLGMKLLNFSKRTLKMEGCKSLLVGTKAKESLDFGRMIERAGGYLIDHLYMIPLEIE